MSHEKRLEQTVYKTCKDLGMKNPRLITNAFMRAVSKNEPVTIESV